jgi:hypothetical protein
LTHLKAICNNTALRFFSLYPPPTRYLFRLQDGVSQEEKKTPSTPCVHLLFALHIIDVFGSLVPKMTFFFSLSCWLDFRVCHVLRTSLRHGWWWQQTSFGGETV